MEQKTKQKIQWQCNANERTCTGWPKKVSHYQMNKNRVKSC